MKAYSMVRGGETKAQVVTLDNGKCIVSWPTSTIIYDSEEDARKVHITHMGGRGEPTEFVEKEIGLVFKSYDPESQIVHLEDPSDGRKCRATPEFFRDMVANLKEFK